MLWSPAEAAGAYLLPVDLKWSKNLPTTIVGTEGAERQIPDI